MKKYKIGYTAGVYDLFHIGHLNLLKNAKNYCERLIVGVTVDELVSYKGKKAVVPYTERIRIVEAIRYVDRVIPQTDLDKYKAWEELHYNVLFVGDDWKGHPNWDEYERKLTKQGVDVVYLPYTCSISSSLLRQRICEKNKGEHNG